MLDVRWSLTWNVTQNELRGTFSPWLWQVLRYFHFVLCP